jgi:ParB family chromosome partitioning protein
MRENVRDDEIENLMSSIKQVGLLEPLVVRKVGDRYGLVCGHRRLTALRLLGNALCLAKVLDITDREALIVRMHENSHRENVNPVDEAVYIGRVMTELDLSVADIADRLGRSQGYVYDRLAILQFPEYLLGPVAEKKISISAAIALNKIQDETTKKNFIEIAAKDGITLERANAWVAMVSFGQITHDTTKEQIEAMAVPAQHSETRITCAKCQQDAAIREMMTVWIHRICPESEPELGTVISTEIEQKLE